MSGNNLRVYSGQRVCMACAKIRDQTPKRKARLRKLQNDWRRRQVAAGKHFCGYSQSIATTVTQHQIDEMVAAIKQAGRVNDAYAIFSRNKTTALIRFVPGLKEQVRQIKTEASQKLICPRVATNLRATTLTGVIAAQPDALFSAIDAAVSRRLHRFIRDDVMGELAELVLSGDLTLSDLPAAARKLTSRHYSAIKFGPLSLDAPAFRDGSIPLVETISQGIWQ